MKTPVAFIIFNRPDTTMRVFEAIRKAKPAKLLVVADGPRAERPDDAKKCHATRAIIEQVDWPCEVLKNYSDVNLGCRKRVSSGLDWVFETVEEAIILEDDCLPNPTFFPFCEELLARYRDDERVMMISGDNFQVSRKRTSCSYYFSHFAHIWGWASWRRAWNFYDVEIKLWPEIDRYGWLNDILTDRGGVRYWSNIFSQLYSGRINTWDYQWTFACWMQRGLSIMPHVNLVSNIGFGDQSTHTSLASSPYANMKTYSMEFPLLHPHTIIRDAQADLRTSRKIFGATNIPAKIFDRIKRVLR